MKIPSLEYYEDTNTLVLQLSPGPGVGAEEIEEDVIVTFDKERRLVGIEFLGDVAREYPELVEAARQSGGYWTKEAAAEFVRQDREG